MQMELFDDSISTSTASNSDLEEESSAVNNNQNTSNSIQTPNPTQISSNIQTIAVQSSSEVHFGNRIVCNGLVTINSPENEDLKQEKQSRKEKKGNLFTLITFVLFSAVTVLIIILYKLAFIDNEKSNTDKGNNHDGLKIISRDEWNATFSLRNHKSLKHEIDIVLGDFIDKPDCYSQETCNEIIREIQNNFTASNEFHDIGYNFLIGTDGTIYEGLGWDYGGYYNKGGNENVICIGFIYDQSTTYPMAPKIAFYQLLDQGFKLGKLSSNPNFFTINKKSDISIEATTIMHNFV